MAADIQPAFIQAKGLHQRGIAPADGAHAARKSQVHPLVGGHQGQGGALLPGLPQHIAGLDAAGFGLLGFGQHNAVAQLGVAANHNRLAPQGGVKQHLHCGIKAVAVAVQNGTHLFIPFAQKENKCSL